MSKIFYDLDKIVKPTIEVKLQGKILSFQSPRVNQLLKLLLLMEDYDEKNGTREALVLIKGLKEVIGDIIPATKNMDLGIDDIIGLFRIIQENMTPNDLKELQKQGIQLDQKKSSVGLKK